jgi:Flp pilus assembly protein TadD
MSSDVEKRNSIRLRAGKVFLFISIAVLFGVYAQVRDHEFISLDDPLYVADNDHVLSGLTPENIKWSFSLEKKRGTHWHPISWMSHQLDIELFGLDAGKHHLSSLFIHALSVILIYLVLRKMTGTTWRSALVAALFALHPLSVNSVAWITERKDVLYAFFWLATLLAYFYYTKKPSIAAYATALFLFVLGLMSKPMIVTLPFTLLLLDFWPLGRIDYKDKKAFLRLLLEKVPFFVLLAVSLFIYLAAFSENSQLDADTMPMKLKVENALVSYLWYIGMIAVPHDQSVFYPFSSPIPFWKVLVSGGLIVIATGFVLLKIKKYPYLFMGWFWYLGTLVPAIGFRQVGFWPGVADRFVYFPKIGLFIIAVWGGYDLLSRLRYRTILASLCVTIFFGFFITQTFMHLKTWKNSILLFENAIRVTKDNHVMHHSLGMILAAKGRMDEARIQYKKEQTIKIKLALELRPNDAKLHNNLGTLLITVGNVDKAIEHYKLATKANPNYTNAFLNLCNAYNKTGDFDKAITACNKALDIEPDSAKGHFDLGTVFQNKGLLNDAIDSYSAAIELAPDMAVAHTNLAIVFGRTNRFDEALVHFEKVVRLKPDDPSAHNDLCFLFFKKGQLDEARRCWGQVLEMDPNNEKARRYLQRHMNAGRFQDL